MPGDLRYSGLIFNADQPGLLEASLVPGPFPTMEFSVCNKLGLAVGLDPLYGCPERLIRSYGLAPPHLPFCLCSLVPNGEKGSYPYAFTT